MPFNVQNNKSFFTKPDTDENKSIIEKAKEKGANYTQRGTRICKPGETLDKNAFFRILSAELSNQDPTKAKDGTEYVSQMAQFTSLEQMMNLNSMMKLNGAANFVGKVVLLRKFDPQGNQYAGIVRNVIKDGDSIKLNIEYEPGKTDAFDMEDIVNITDDLNMINKHNNNFLNAVTMIGKEVELNDGETTLNAIVNEVKRDGNSIMLNVTSTIKDSTGKETSKDLDVPLEYLVKVKGKK